ncbi:MAG: nucleotide exchange factor GrpE [Corynebacterium matruchotii]|uniref:nucleotide exchange factor GrpE n=1 Tax=Corynebacterium matruchotii TaxID=43768 RepID=UPI0036070510
MTDDKPEVERDEDNTDVDANPKLIDLSSDAKKAAKDADQDASEDAEATADTADDDGDADALDAGIDTADLAEVAAALDQVAADAEAESTEPSLEEQLAERTNDLQRLGAEYANYRRRTQAEREQVIENAKAQVVMRFLPIVDDFGLAEQHGDLAEGPMKAFHDKFMNVLDGLKLQAFGDPGDEFDAETYEAVQDMSTGDTKTVGTVLRKGYKLNGRLLRTAMVIIADPPVDSESESDES